MKKILSLFLSLSFFVTSVPVAIAQSSFEVSSFEIQSIDALGNDSEEYRSFNVVFSSKAKDIALVIYNDETNEYFHLEEVGGEITALGILPGNWERPLRPNTRYRYSLTANSVDLGTSIAERGTFTTSNFDSDFYKQGDGTYEVFSSYDYFDVTLDNGLRLLPNYWRTEEEHGLYFEVKDGNGGFLGQTHRFGLYDIREERPQVFFFGNKMFESTIRSIGYIGNKVTGESEWQVEFEVASINDYEFEIYDYYVDVIDNGDNRKLSFNAQANIDLSGWKVIVCEDPLNCNNPDSYILGLTTNFYNRVTSSNYYKPGAILYYRFYGQDGNSNIIWYPSNIGWYSVTAGEPISESNEQMSKDQSGDTQIDLSFSSSHKGKIFLQVQDSGQAWYVRPTDSRRYYLGRPSQAFEIMRQAGVGITNADLRKIPIGVLGQSNYDSDGDGLSDAMETGLGSNPFNIDSDGDGYDDRTEVLSGYDPAGFGKLPISSSFTNQHLGKIFIQVEQGGEAWYVNPSDGKRYFLGRPADAFEVMRQLGIGITNDNLRKIEVGEL